MTAQVPDLVLLGDTAYCLSGVCGDGLFDPEEHGLAPAPTCSACWRGYQCCYALRDGRFVLDALYLCTAADGTEPPVLFGVAASPGDGFFTWKFDGLDHDVKFSGGLLLGDDFVDELYVHMGFHPAWKYRAVHECLIKHGAVLSTWDKSAEMAELRERLATQPLEPADAASRHDVASWVRQCFRLDYAM